MSAGSLGPRRLLGSASAPDPPPAPALGFSLGGSPALPPAHTPHKWCERGMSPKAPRWHSGGGTFRKQSLGGGHWRCVLEGAVGPSPASPLSPSFSPPLGYLLRHTPRRVVLPHQSPGTSGAAHSWTPAPRTISQNKPLDFLSSPCRVFCYRVGELTHTTSSLASKFLLGCHLLREAHPDHLI